MNIIKYNSPNKELTRKGYIPDMIICHITEGAFDGACSWLCNPASGASTHFVVARDGRIAQLVDLRHTAWGNGTTNAPGNSRYFGYSNLKLVRERAENANYFTISIEHEGFYNQTHGALTEAQYKASKWLVGYIRDEVKRIYGKTIPLDREHIAGHCDVAPRWKPTCPGERFPFDRMLKELGNAVMGDDEVVEKSKVKINGKIYVCDRILKEGSNFIKLRDLEQAGVSIGYDTVAKIPIVSFKNQ